MGRIRKIKDAKHLILQFERVINQPSDKYFSNNNPLYLEVGCGKGDFIIEKSLQNKDINFIAIEKEPTIVYKLLRKINNLLIVLTNLKILCIDANDLSRWFNQGVISELYLNFSDPWPKKRHEKFRLTNNTFLNIYHRLLKKDAMVYLKTDQQSLYEYSIDSINNSKLFKIINKSSNLYNDSKLLINNVQTEYEKKFVNLQHHIFYLSFKKI